MPSTPSTAAADIRQPVALTPELVKKFDDLCDTYAAAEETSKAAKKAFDRADDELQAFVDRHGVVPDGAEKSLRVVGALYQATSTRGTTVALQDGYIAKLEKQLSRVRRSHLFPQLFTRTVAYQMVKGAGDLLKSAALSKRSREDILATYAQCVDVRPKAPSLAVVTLVALAAGATKAGRKGGK